MTEKDKTTLAVVGLVGFSLLGCCGLTLAAGGYAAWQDEVERRAAGPQPEQPPRRRASPPQSAPPAAPLEEFARALEAELADAGHGGFTFDAEDEALVRDGGTLSLTNLHGEWAQLAADERAGFVRRAALGAFPPEVPKRWADAQPNVLVTVRERLFVELLLLREGGGPGTIHRPLADDLVEVAVWDTEHAMQYVTATQVAEWGVTADEIFATGRRQLLARSAAPFLHPGDGVLESPWQDNHDVGRAALTDLVRSLEVKGDPVVFLPHRDHLLVAGADDPEALLSAATAARELLAQPRAMSGRAWRVTQEGKLEPFQPRGAGVAATVLAELRRRAQVRDANEQKGSLDEKHQREGADVFVASALLVGDDAQGERTYSVWTRDVETLLPRTDFVVFVDPDRPEAERLVAAAPWERVERQLAGGLRAEPGLWPARYRVRGFPEPKVLRALGRHPLFTPRE